jgi:hypothetical protein
MTRETDLDSAPKSEGRSKSKDKISFARSRALNDGGVGGWGWGWVSDYYLIWCLLILCLHTWIVRLSFYVSPNPPRSFQVIISELRAVKGIGRTRNSNWRLMKRRVNQLKCVGSVWGEGWSGGGMRITEKIRARRKERGEISRPTPIGSSLSHRHTIAQPNGQGHHHSHDRYPQSLRPSSFVSSHVPTQQSHKETRHQSHGPLADQERRMDALELLVQEMEEWIVNGHLIVTWSLCNE